EALIRIALASPSVAFTLRSGERITFQSPANADPRERIAAAVGKEIHRHLLEADWEQGAIAVRGFVASPDWSTTGTRAIYTYVNGRYVRDRQLLHAIQRAYAEVLPHGRSPGAFLHFDLPPSDVDVNVHPQKLEVRFAEPRAVYEAALRAVKEALRTTRWLEAKPAAKIHFVPSSTQPAFDWSRKPASGGAAARQAAELLWPRPEDPLRVAEAPVSSP